MSSLEDRLEEATTKWEAPARVITGGKGPPDPPGLSPDDWLTALPIKTTVLIQSKKDQTPFLGQMVICSKGERAVLLYIPGTTQKPEWVDPVRWCRDYRLYETLQTAEEADQEERAREIVSRSNPPAEMVDTETSEDVD